MRTLKFPDGQERPVAPACFSRETVRLMEICVDAPREGQSENMGELIRLVWQTLHDSLVRGGATPEDAEAALKTVEMGKPFEEFLGQALEALGLGAQ